MLKAAQEKTKEAKKAAKELSDTLEANARMGMALLDAAAPEGALVLMELDLGEHRHRFPVVEGYLDKQKKKGAKLWQKRWFVLAGGRLDYHKSRKDATAGMAPLGTIWATNLLLVRILEGAEHAGTFSIEVYRDDKPDNPRVFSFKAASDELVRQWVEALDRSRRLVADLGVELRETDTAQQNSPPKELHGMPTHQDYLLKQNPKGMWQKRWFILSNCQLSYASSQSAAPSGTISLAGCTGMTRDNGNACSFSVDTGQRIFRLMAETEFDADEWFELLQKSFQIAGGAGGASRQPCSAVEDFDQSGTDAAALGVQQSVDGAFAGSGDDVPSFLKACESCLQELLSILTELAETGHYDRTDVSDFYSSTYNSLLFDRASKYVLTKADPTQWQLSDAAAFVIWCNEYHSRLMQAGAQALDLKLTDIGIVATLTEQYLPGCEGHAKKRSPKGGKIHVWQARWFVLQHCNLVYYKSHKDDEPLGVIQLHSVTSLVRKEGSNEIKMVVAGRKTWIQFETDSDVVAWMTALQRSWEAAGAVDNARSGTKKISSKTCMDFDNSNPRALQGKIVAKFGEKFAGCDGDIIATLNRGEAMIDEITSILDDIAYCQPPRPDIAEFYATEYQIHLYNNVRQFLEDAMIEELEATHILRLVAWVYSYHDRLVKLGVNLTHDLSLVPTFQQMLEFVPQASGAMQKMIPRAKVKGVKAWQKRYFVLKHCILYYYKQKPNEGDAPQGEIRMDQLRSLTLSGKKRGGLGLKLCVGRRVFYLMVQTLEELEMWVDAIDRSTMRGVVERVDMDAYTVPSTEGQEDGNQRRQTQDGPVAVQAPIDDSQFSGVFNTRDVPPTAEEVEEDLEAAGDLVQQLIARLDGIIFNQGGDEVLEETARSFHSRMVVQFQSYMVHGEDFEQGAIHSVLSWLYDYHNELDEVGAQVLDPVLYQVACIEPMMNSFEQRMLGTVVTWCDNLVALERDPETEIEHEDGEGLHTRGPVDLFKMIQQQVSTAHATGVESFTFRIFKMCESIFAHLQKCLATLVGTSWRELSLEYMCALVNNSCRMMELNMEMTDQAEEWMSESFWTQLDIEGSVEGFLPVLNAAIEAIASVVLADLDPLLDGAFKSAWYKENQMETVVATVADFFGDLQFWLQGQFFKKVAMRILDRVVRHYVDSMLNKKLKLGSKFAEQVMMDMQNLVELADPEHGFVREKSLRRHVRAADDVLELLTAQEPNLVDKMTTTYTRMLQTHASVSLAIVERCLRIRTDLKKRHAKAILESCGKGAADGVVGPDPDSLFHHWLCNNTAQ